MSHSSKPTTIYLKDYTQPNFWINTTNLEVDIGTSATTVTTTLGLQRRETDSNSPLHLKGGEELQLLWVHLNGQPLAAKHYTREGENLVIHSLPNQCSLTLCNTIKPHENTRLEGLYQSGDMLTTQCEAEGFRHITFHADRPDVMSVFTTTIKADAKKYPILLSNGNNIKSGQLEDGRHFATWHDPFKKPCHLFALVAGDLMYTEDSFTTQSGRKVTLRLFAEHHNSHKTAHGMACLKNAMAWDEKAYGREYDLDIFMIVAVDAFNMGAMENKGLNIFNSSCVLANPQTTTDAGFKRIDDIVAHEYFHNWSGNRVNCRDWFQLSLKEGFTVLREQQYSASTTSPVVKRIEDVDFLRTHQFAEDAGPTAHPIRPSSFIEISNFYTLTVYEKGAEVLRMMHTLVGEEKWRKGTDIYFSRHDGQAVTTEDFVKAIEDGSQTDLSQFGTWYNQAGTPHVQINGDYNAEEHTYTLTFRQHTRPTPETPHKKPFIIPVKLGLLNPQGEDMPLHTDNPHFVPETSVFVFSKEHQTLTFHSVAHPPVPSLFRHFSAPVTVDFPYTRAELVFLMAHDTDGFNRWNACNTLACTVLLEAAAACQKHTTPVVDSLLIDAYRNLLTSHQADPETKAMMLTLPAESYLAERMAEQMGTADPDAIHAARTFVRRTLAQTLQAELQQLYAHHNTGAPYAYTGKQVADRSLKNTCLSLLMSLEKPAYISLAERQFTQADNMTDSLAALSALVNCPAAEPQAQAALAQFYTTWQHDTLVMDTWLRVQCAASKPGNLAHVRQLMQHPVFDIKNPNKVRSVVGAFCSVPVNFHAADGSGYTFLAEQVAVLNTLNPQIASRLVAPLLPWRKYTPNRQQLMQAQLQHILALPNLSQDVYEVVSKALA